MLRWGILPISRCMSHSVVTGHPVWKPSTVGAAKAAQWKPKVMLLRRGNCHWAMKQFLSQIHYTTPSLPPWEQLIHPNTKRRGSAALASSPTCLQVQRDPRLVDVRRVALGADPPDRSAVYLLFRGRRHVPPAGQRPLATGATARDSAPQQPLVHPRRQAV